MKPQFFDADKTPAGGADNVPARNEVRSEDTWDLSHLFPSEDAWTVAFQKLQESFPALERFKGHVADSSTSLLECLELEKTISLLSERLGHYAGLRSSEDSSDSGNLARESQLDNLQTRINEATAFIAPEIMAVDDGEFEKLLAAPELAPWRTSLRKHRRYKPHTLSEREERLLALGYSPLRGHSETFSQLTNVDMQFGQLSDSSGKERPLTQSSYSSFLVQRDPAVRKAAFHQFYAEFAAHKFTLASSYANSVKADVFSARARNYPSAREAALFHDDVPVSVYDNLIATVHAHLPPLFQYYKLRKRLLNLPEIHQYDTYVPIVDRVQTRVTFDEAIDKVVSALTPLGDEYCTVLRAGLARNRWCDRYESRGKRSGAFSSSSYGNPPYILMNYKEDVFADIYTLAHEAGHSMHTWYAQRSQSFQDYHYPIFLAEVASTFNEELLTHALLEQTNDRQLRAYILNRQIDDIRGTIYRQTMFAEFEKITHAMEEAGEPLTLDTLTKSYRALLEIYFGPDFALDPELDLECLRIPHFYNAFYVYKYATGLSAAIALSQQVLQSGDAQRYLGFLKSGGSQLPLPTLATAGVDMSSPAPVQAALQLFSRRVEELEALLS